MVQLGKERPLYHQILHILGFSELLLLKKYFSAQMFLGSPDEVHGKPVHEYCLLSVKTCDKHGQQMLRA